MEDRRQKCVGCNHWLHDHGAKRIIEILLPSTDTVVAIEFAVVFLVALGGLWIARKNPDVGRLVFGVSVLLIGLMAIRAIH